MKPIYCTDTMDRIPLELFKQGKAVWCDGRPYLLTSAKRLGLRFDIKPPAEFAVALGFAPVAAAKPAEAPKVPAAVPAIPQQAVPPKIDLPKAAAKPVELPDKKAAGPIIPPGKIVIAGKNRDEAFHKMSEAPTVATNEPPPKVPPVEAAKKVEPRVTSKIADTLADVPKPPALKPLSPLNAAKPTPAAQPTVSQPRPAKWIKPGDQVDAANDDQATIIGMKMPQISAANPATPEPKKPDVPVALVAKKSDDVKPQPFAAPIPVKPAPAEQPIGNQPRAAKWIKPGEEIDAANDDQATITGMKLPQSMVAKPAAPEPKKPDAAVVIVAKKSDVEQLKPAQASVTLPAATVDAKKIEAVPQSAKPAIPTPPKAAEIERAKVMTEAESHPVAKDVPIAKKEPAAPAKPPVDAPINPTVTLAPVATPAKVPEPIARVALPTTEAHAAVVPAKQEPPPVPAKPAALVAAAPVPQAKPVVPAKPVAAAAAKTDDEMEIEIPLTPGRPLKLEEMKKLEILQGIPDAIIKRLYGGIVEREFKKGDLICRQGDYASTAFYIKSGTVEIYTVTPSKAALAPLKKQNQVQGLSLREKFLFWVQGRKEGSRKTKSGRRPDIANVPELPPGLKPIELHAGDLVGEMSCINFYPRSANVRAKDDCVVIELIRTVLDAVRTRKSTYKQKLDDNYRERSLAEHLNRVPIFEDLDREFIDELRKRVELRDFEPGEVIFRQHDKADAFYIIRHGCVKVSQTHPGGELVLTYLGQNDAFGEIGLMQKDGKRGATCTALNHVEIVKIEKKHFDVLTQCYDDFKNRVVKIVNEREATNERLANAKDISDRQPTRPLAEFIDHELMQAQRILLIDLEKCTRCDECVKACVDSHDDGKTRLMREGLRFDKFLLATSCRSCMDPVCMIGCPVGAIRRETTSEIIIEDWCIGCERCAKQCPYGNITMHEFPLSGEELARKERDEKEKEEAQRKKAAAAAAKPDGEVAKKPAANPAHANEVMKIANVKKMAVTCDQCSTLQEPSCVYACPHDAAMRVNARDYFEIVGKSTLKEAGKSGKTT